MNNKHPARQMFRKLDLAQQQPDRISKLRAAAEELSRRNMDTAIVELMAEAVQRLTLLCYEVEGGTYCNVDAVTGRLLIPAPWGKHGYARWGLRFGESEVLREMMQGRQVPRLDGAPGVFGYDRSRRAWLVNFFDYDRSEDAQRYWQRWPLTVAEFRQARMARNYP